jgi:hypothetical protein
LSERRHRLYSIEIPEVKRGLKLRLQELCEAKEDEETAEVAFRALFRLSRDEPGRPKYPEFTWDMAYRYLDLHKDE